MNRFCCSIVALCLALFSPIFTERISASSGISVDPSFGLNLGLDGSIFSAAVQPDGKLVVGGAFSTLKGAARNGIARLNADGSNDAGFNLLGANGPVTAVALQADGKVLIGGNFTSVNGQPRSSIARLNADGSLDSTFESHLPGPSYRYSWWDDEKVRQIIPQEDGKVLVNARAVRRIDWEDWASGIVRLNEDGSVDAGFDPLAGFQEAWAYRMIMTPDGGILLLGEFYNGEYRSFLRLNADGAVDDTFALPFDDVYLQDVVFLSGGKMLVAGYFHDGENEFADLFRLNADGTVDEGFQFGVEGDVYRLAVAGDGKIFVGGYLRDSNDKPVSLVLLNNDGSLVRVVNASFDPEGTRVFLIQPNNNLLFGKWSSAIDGTTLGRLNANGTVENGFSIPTTPFEDVEIGHILRQPGGKTLLFGYFGDYPHSLIRLNSDGSLDGTFQSNVTGEVYRMLLQADGKILLHGDLQDRATGNAYPSVMRLNINGSVDQNFAIVLPDEEVYTLALQSDGGILVAGSFYLEASDSYRPLLRFNPDGSLDDTFDTVVKGPSFGMALQADGKIVLHGFLSIAESGEDDKYLGIARLNADGSLDESFHFDMDSEVYAMALQPDGKVLLRGDFWREDIDDYFELPGFIRINSDGTLDSGFNSSLRGEFSKMLLQPDGKILVHGEFWDDDDASSRLARLNRNGSRDPTFDLQLNDPEDDWAQVHAVALDEHGNILIGGWFRYVNGIRKPYLARLNTNILYPGIAIPPASKQFVLGSTTTLSVTVAWDLPTTYQWFHNGVEIAGATSSSYAVDSVQGADAGTYSVAVSNTHGTVTISNLVATLVLNRTGSVDLSFDPGSGLDRPPGAIVVQEDGKVLIGGRFKSVRGAVRSGIARLNADGTNDDSFDPGLGANGRVGALSVQPDGAVLIGGDFTAVNGIERIGLARLNPDGSLDEEFDAQIDGEIYAMALQDDGKIIVGGYFWSVGETEMSSLARLNSDGSLDTSFDLGEGVTDSESWPGEVMAVSLQPDGGIVIGGFFSYVSGESRKNLARLNPDGSLDPSFAPNLGSWVSIVRAQADGTFLAVVDSERVMRLNPDGAVSHDFESELDSLIWIADLQIQPDGKILVAGELWDEPRTDLKRLNPDGSLDEEFDPGRIHESVAVAVEPDGSILVGAYFIGEGAIARTGLARLDGGGRLDGSLDADGAISGSIQTTARQADGKVLIGGWFPQIQGRPAFGIERLNTDGSLDDEFLCEFDLLEVSAIALQPDNKILVAGWFWDSDADQEFSILVWLNTNGSLDDTFTIWEGAYFGFTAVLLQSDGRILLGSYDGLFRLHADGQWDESFEEFGEDVSALSIHPSGAILIGGQDGFSVRDADGNWFIDAEDFEHGLESVSAIATQADGQILIAGKNYDGAVRIVRLNVSGARDQTFRPIFTGFHSPWSEHFVSEINAISIQDDGKILIGGWFSSVNGVARQGIARMNPDGSLDIIFDPGSGADDEIRAMLLQPDGQVIIAGAFSSVDGIARSRIARLHGDNEITEPVLLAQPQSQTVVAGGDATFSVTAAGAEPFTYQWFYNGEEIEGATDSQYVRANLMADDAGTYSVLVGNAAGTILSATATLTVNAPPEDATFLSIARFVEGEFLLELSGPADRSYVIETTTNLIDWTVVSTNSTDSGGAISVITSESPPAPQRFFRAFQEP